MKRRLDQLSVDNPKNFKSFIVDGTADYLNFVFDFGSF